MQIERRAKYTSKTKFDNPEIIDKKFDISALNAMCSYVISENRNLNRSQLMNLKKLFNRLDEANYKDPELLKRYIFIKRGLEARLTYNLSDIELIKSHINGGFSESSFVDYKLFKELSNNDIDWLNKVISTELTYSDLDKSVKTILNGVLNYQSSDYTNKDINAKELINILNTVQSTIRKNKVAESQAEVMFSLGDGMEDHIREYHAQLCNPANKIRTGMQGMNQMLDGGFECGRVYLYLGLQGDGKSWTLLNLAKQIKRWNPDFKTKDPTKRPCVVLLTMENTVRESVNRLFTLVSDDRPMTDFEVEEVIKILKEDGELSLTDKSPIDIIIKYKANKSVDTSYLYELAEDLEDDGYEMIALVQDYVMRIRSTDITNGDIRLELGAIIDEFKVFATIKDIPVITASQLNRDAATKVDEGRKVNKADLVRILGRSNTGESMMMINNADFVSLLAVEYDTNGNKYLGIQVVKSRFKMIRQFCFLSFVNGSMLMDEDEASAIPSFRDTLRVNMTGMTPKNNIQMSAYQPMPKDIKEIMLENDVSTQNAFDELILSGKSVSSNNTNTSEIIKPLNISINKVEEPIMIRLPINKKFPTLNEYGEEIIEIGNSEIPSPIMEDGFSHPIEYLDEKIG
jgi:hypothetical protein